MSPSLPLFLSPPFFLYLISPYVTPYCFITPSRDSLLRLFISEVATGTRTFLFFNPPPPPSIPVRVSLRIYLPLKCMSHPITVSLSPLLALSPRLTFSSFMFIHSSFIASAARDVRDLGEYLPFFYQGQSPSILHSPAASPSRIFSSFVFTRRTCCHISSLR